MQARYGLPAARAIARCAARAIQSRSNPLSSLENRARRFRSAKVSPGWQHVQQAAAGTTQVAGSVTDVSRGAAETGSASSQVLSSAQSLANDSNRLKLELGKFLATVRAA